MDIYLFTLYNSTYETIAGVGAGLGVGALLYLTGFAGFLGSLVGSITVGTILPALLRSFCDINVQTQEHGEL